MELELASETLHELTVTTKTWEDFKQKVEKERELVYKQEALALADVRRSIAMQIPGGRPDCPLSGMEEEKTRRKYGVKIADALAEAQAGRTRGGSTVKREEENNSKFSMEEGKVADFGELDDYHGGLVDVIGLPTTLDDLYKAIEEEHCNREDSDKSFKPTNYNTETTPKYEWKAVKEAQLRRELSQGKRTIRAVEELMDDERVKQSGLRCEEVVALVLYTGTDMTCAQDG
eukprot:764173-Hanusia_phi.AAC.2